MLYTYARNICIDQLRKNARYVWVENLERFSENINVDSEVTAIINREETNLEVEKILTQMPPRRRQIFSLIKLEGFSYAEVSDRLNISVSTIEKTHA